MSGSGGMRIGETETAEGEEQGIAPPEQPAGRENNGSERALKNYQSAVASGFYQRDTGGLLGKYDNVRRYWEDQITRYVLHDFVMPLVERKRHSLERIRILDLGSGSGEGYEILTSLKKEGDSLVSREVDVLPPEMLGAYKGVDISPAMVEQGTGIYEHEPKVSFVVGDLSEGLGDIKNDAPYDIYFSSYGSLSHLNDAELARLLEDIHEHSHGQAVLVADLVGRYSYEWQCYWDDPPAGGDTMRTYSMSYLYPPELLDRVEPERFPLRFWTAAEFDEHVRATIGNKGGRVIKNELRDRSILVGRHMNTGEYNRHAQPLRREVNCLHEFNVRTDLEALVFDYTPKPGFDRLNAFFDKFQMAWNAVVYAAIEALERANDPDWLGEPPPTEYPEVVQDAIRTIRGVVRNVRWFRMGDPRANVIEPQLGYILRNLEMDLQQGMGAAHGLLAIYEFSKE